MASSRDTLRRHAKHMWKRLSQVPWPPPTPWVVALCSVLSALLCIAAALGPALFRGGVYGREAFVKSNERLKHDSFARIGAMGVVIGHSTFLPFDEPWCSGDCIGVRHAGRAVLVAMSLAAVAALAACAFVLAPELATAAGRSDLVKNTEKRRAGMAACLLTIAGALASVGLVRLGHAVVVAADGEPPPGTAPMPRGLGVTSRDFTFTMVRTVSLGLQGVLAIVGIVCALGGAALTLDELRNIVAKELAPRPFWRRPWRSTGRKTGTRAQPKPPPRAML